MGVALDSYRTIALRMCILLLGQVTVLLAHNEQIRFEHLSVEDGLSQRFVLEVVVDCQGFLWVATEDGLNKYDGYEFKSFRHDPEDSLSLGGNILRQVLESHAYDEHKLWVCTVGGGLACMDLTTERFTNYTHNPLDSTSISNNSVWILEETNFDGIPEIWVGVIGPSLDRLNIKTGAFRRYPFPSMVTDLFYDDEGILWVGTYDHGLGKYDPANDDFTFYEHDPDDPSSLASLGTYDMTEDHLGNLWVGTIGPLDRIDRSGRDREDLRFVHYRHDPNDPTSFSGPSVEYLFEDSKENLWVGTFGGGLNLLDLQTGKFTRFVHNPDNPHSIGSNSIFSIAEDHSGNIWFGHQNGISKWDAQKAPFNRYEFMPSGPTGLENKWITSVISTWEAGEEILWLGTVGKGLCRFNRTTGEITWYLHSPSDPNSLADNTVLSLALPQPDILMIVTWGGLSHFDMKTESFETYYLYPNQGSDYYEDVMITSHLGPSGRLWLGVFNHIAEFDFEENRLQPVAKVRAYAVHESVHQGRHFLWGGSFNNGLLRMDLDTHDKTWYTHESNDSTSIADDMIEALYSNSVLGKDYLWVGTMNGLDRYDYETETFKHYTMEDGLPHNHITCIEEDLAGDLWITSKIGLTRFDPVEEAFETYWKADGLPSDGYEMESIHVNAAGEVFVGGDKGLVSFFPDSLHGNSKAPRVVLTDFKLFHESVPIQPSRDPEAQPGFFLEKHISYMDKLILSYRENIFALSFSALDFRSPEKNQYAYYLEGFESDWNYVDAESREAKYTNLNPGHYTFHVKASNNDGVWNEAGTSLRILITPPWWETTLAYGGYFFMFVLLILGVLRYQLVKIRLKHQVELEHLSAEHYHELDEHKSRFMANISHEFRTPLTLILGPVSNLLGRVKDTGLREDLKLIQRQAKRLLELVIQLMDIAKLENNQMILQASQQNIVPLLKGLVRSFTTLAERNKVALEFDSVAQDIQLYVEREAMVKIFNNLLSNAFKFTEAGNTVRVELSTEETSTISPEGEVVIRVTDTGIGIPQAHLRKVFDRFHQVDTTETRQWGGTGIGLSLTQELVELHRGTIHVQSELKVGTTFTVRLPRGKGHLTPHEIAKNTFVSDSEIQEPNDEPAYDHHDDKSRAKNESVQPMVLIVEDNEDVRHYIRTYLENDYVCQEAIDGRDGLTQVRKHIPDLVICDIMMPKLNGLELCQQIKGDERTSHIPVLMLTAKADMESKVSGLEIGADAYLTKPFEATELKIRIKNLIDQRQALKARFQREFNLIPPDLDISSMDHQFLKRAIHVIHDRIADPAMKVDVLAGEMHMSRQQLNRKLKGLTGRTTVEFLRLTRLKRAAILLRANHASVTEIAYQVGFSNPSHFSRSFHQEFGQTPSRYMTEQNQKNIH